MGAQAVHKPAIALLAGVALTGALAGCAPGPAQGENDATTPANTPKPSAAPTSGATPPESDGAYRDGTYEASGSYQAPSGTESVQVMITLEDDVIVGVEVVGDAVDPEAKLHQGQFIGGIANEVVGKNIDEIQVSRVSGSSLTSGGFNAAVDAIRGQAAA